MNASIAAHSRSTTACCTRRTAAGSHGSSESNVTCSPRSDTSGRPAKITITIRISVSSSAPGSDVEANLRPPTSTKVSSMIANSAAAAIRPHSVWSSVRSGCTEKAMPARGRHSVGDGPGQGRRAVSLTAAS